MIELLNKLRELSDKIGNGATIYLGFENTGKRPPMVIFRVYWPDGYHTQQEYSYMRLDNAPNDLLDIFAEMAKRAYDKV